MADGVPDFEHDLVQDALGLLIQQRKGKRVLVALLGSYVSEVEELRDTIRDLMLARDGRTAYGVWLEGLGAIVGAKRNSAVDDAYRLYINAKIAQNKSSGRWQDFELIFELLGNDPATLKVTESYPATATIYSTEPLNTGLIPGPDMLDVLKRLFFSGKTQAAGVRLYFVFTLTADTFQYSNAGDASVTAHSYSDAGDPGSLIYGKWSSTL